jgi:hypothetical protein
MNDHPEGEFSLFLGSPLRNDPGDLFHHAEEPLQDQSENLDFCTADFDMEEDSEQVLGETFFEAFLDSDGLGAGRDKDDLRILDRPDQAYWEAASVPVSSSENPVSTAVLTKFKRKRVREYTGTGEESSLLHEWSSSNDNESKEDAYDSSDEIHDGYADPQEELPEHMKDSFLRSVESQPNIVSAVEMEESQLDVYGKAELMEEDAEMVKAARNEMDKEIEKLKVNYGAYLMAENVNPEFVKDPKLRIRFLRVSDFNGKDAASKILHSFEVKLELWGPDRIAERITISNMGPGPRNALENGHMQLLPSKDLGGRRVLFNNVNRLRGFEDPLDQVRLARSWRRACPVIKTHLAFSPFLWISSCGFYGT